MRLVPVALLALVVGASRPRVALVATFAGGGPTWKRHSVDGLVRRFVAEHAPWLDALASTVERVAITHNVSAASRAALARAGWCVRDFTHVALGAYHRPVYSAAAAARRDRRVYPFAPLHARADGARTLAKLLAFALVEYERVLAVDADVALLARPDEALRAAAAAPEQLFAARAEPRVWGADAGMQSNVMLLAPSLPTLHALLLRARRGQYLPFTNTEQDVLEAHFTLAAPFEPPAWAAARARLATAANESAAPAPAGRRERRRPRGRARPAASDEPDAPLEHRPPFSARHPGGRWECHPNCKPRDIAAMVAALASDDDWACYAARVGETAAAGGGDGGDANARATALREHFVSEGHLLRPMPALLCAPEGDTPPPPDAASRCASPDDGAPSPDALAAFPPVRFLPCAAAGACDDDDGDEPDAPPAETEGGRFVAFAHKQEHGELQACVAELQVARAEALAHRNATAREREHGRVFTQNYRTRRRAAR